MPLRFATVVSAALLMLVGIPDIAFLLAQQEGQRSFDLDRELGVLDAEVTTPAAKANPAGAGAEVLPVQPAAPDPASPVSADTEPPRTRTPSAPDSPPNFRGGVSSDLSSELHSLWRIRAVSRVIGQQRQTVLLRFTPIREEVAAAGPIDVFLTHSSAGTRPVEVDLARGTRVKMQLDRLDASQDSISIHLTGDVIRGQPFSQETLRVQVE